MELYPELYAENPPASFKEDSGTVYLTFDDGPFSACSLGDNDLTGKAACGDGFGVFLFGKILEAEESRKERSRGDPCKKYRIDKVLKKFNAADIKATFFVCGGEDEKSQQLMRDIVNAGHTIGIHSISHD